MLVLPIKKKNFDMILSEEKDEEYKEIKPYYNKIFKKYLYKKTNENEYFFPIFELILRNGQSYKAPSIKCTCIIYTDLGKEEWGAKSNKKYYVLKILEILEVKNINGIKRNKS